MNYQENRNWSHDDNRPKYDNRYQSEQEDDNRRNDRQREDNITDGYPRGDRYD